jgi:hypothetical protein
VGNGAARRAHPILRLLSYPINEERRGASARSSVTEGVAPTQGELSFVNVFREWKASQSVPWQKDIAFARAAAVKMYSHHAGRMPTQGVSRSELANGRKKPPASTDVEPVGLVATIAMAESSPRALLNRCSLQTQRPQLCLCHPPR